MSKDSNRQTNYPEARMSLKDSEDADEEDLRSRVRRVIDEDRELFDALDN
jgi:hypothetical protein